MIHLLENQASGHSMNYTSALKEIEDVIDKTSNIKFENRKWHFNYFKDRVKFLYEKTKELKEKDVLHLLYLDNLYTVPFIGIILNDKRIIGTLHNIPEGKIKRILLKNISKKMKTLIVHSSFSEETLIKIGIKNVTVINYPSFFDYSRYENKSILRNQLGIDEKKFVISALGTTRHDKGLDILLESFKLLNKDMKKHIILNIVGKEGIYTKEFIESKAKEYKINIKLELKFITDAEFCKNILITDCLVLPYRKYFTSNSGPMTEALVNNINIIAPKEINLGKILKKYGGGITFKCENVKSLKQAIEETFILKNKLPITEYSKELTVKNFKERYAQLYRSI